MQLSACRRSQQGWFFPCLPIYREWNNLNPDIYEISIPGCLYRHRKYLLGPPTRCQPVTSDGTRGTTPCVDRDPRTSRASHPGPRRKRRVSFADVHRWISPCSWVCTARDRERTLPMAARRERTDEVHGSIRDPLWRSRCQRRFQSVQL